MVYYPTATEVIEANKIALNVTRDKHPHKLTGSAKGIQHLIDDIGRDEKKGLTYQAARFLKELVTYHAFDGGNHRTSYLVTLLFLVNNGQAIRSQPARVMDEFIEDVQAKPIEEVHEWIQRHMVK
jgi:prophage maintenance system killer protein